MVAAIVYESLFGNTGSLVRHVARGLEDEGLDVVVRRAGDGTGHDFPECDLLVLGAPTHALSLSTPATRADAVARGARRTPARGGLREWLAAQDQPAGGLPPTAVFDTRATIARHWPGSAARRTARMLRRRGVTVLLRTSFYVEGVTGPVVEGEAERARAWGRAVARASRLVPTAPGPGA